MIVNKSYPYLKKAKKRVKFKANDEIKKVQAKIFQIDSSLFCERFFHVVSKLLNTRYSLYTMKNDDLEHLIQKGNSGDKKLENSGSAINSISKCDYDGIFGKIVKHIEKSKIMAFG